MGAILVHYHEVGLKGRNRPLFIGRLARNLAEATRGLGVRRIEKLTGRLLAVLEPWADRARILERVGSVFGVANYSLARRLPLDAGAIREAGAELLAPKTFRTFRVETRRAFKGLPIRSQDLDREVGSYIQARRHIPVDLTAP
ncbi:MAG: THUMP domain-containing protein, partial [Nitrospinota bacterium]